MGFSLKKLGRSIEDVLGTAQHGVSRTVAQVTPLDNGRTWQNPQGNAPMQHGPAPSAFQQAVHSAPGNFITPVARLGSQVGQAAYHIGTLPVETARTATAELTNNPAATQAGIERGMQGINAIKGLAQGTTSMAYQLGESLNPVGGDVYNRQHTFQNPVARAVFGSAPIPSMQKQYKDTKATKGAAQASGEALTTVLMDTLGAKAVAAKAPISTKQVVSAAKKVPVKLETPEIAALKAQKAVSIKAMDTATPKMMKQHVANVNSIDRQIATLQARGGAKAGDILPDKAFGKPKVSLKEQQMGEALGMTKDQVAEAKANMAELPAKEQMAKFEQTQTPLAPAAANTAKNPFKAPIPEVKVADYKQIVSNEQTAANPTLVAGDRWKAAMQKLQKSDPQGYNDFWRNVEDPRNAKSPELQKAIKAWRNVDDRIHGTSQALGGNTNYLTEHGLHPWNLPDELAQHLTNGGDINKFPGLNSISRKYRTIAEGEANGLTLGADPLGEGSKYIGASAGSLRRRAIVKGIGEADGHTQDKTHFLDLGGGETIPMSEGAHKALKGLQKARYTDNKAAVGVRTVNQGLRTTILSGGQFHPINISLLRAAPSIALAGHPVRAVKGAVNTFTATKGRVGKMYESALSDKIVDPGTKQSISIVDAAAKIGAQYAQKGYDVEGSALKSGVGHKLVFEQQIPMMHDQVVRSVLSDLVKKGIPLDSKAAREAGIAANSTMGFINKEALNVPTWVRKGMSDWMLASQFTPSKIVTLSKVAKGGVAGKYARSDVLSNVVAATALITGVGYALGQTSDNMRDSLLRALVNPAVPTPMKDSKGNNIELRIPLTYTGEISKILGIKLKRQEDGHLGVTWHPSESLSPHGGLAEWMRSRLAPVQSTAVKLATNTNFSDKPLSDPNAPAGTRAIQDATTIGQGFLPIGLQGIPNTKIVKDHVPGSVKDILEANTPGANPVIKGFASSAGFSPRTDQTVGKGLETNRYFTAVDEFKPKDRQSKDAYDLWTGSKKNPVTGKYDVNPSVYDASTKANALLQNPKAFDAIYNMNQSLAKQGEKVDPLWSLPKDNIRNYLDYQHMPPGSADKTNWYNKNGDWYGPLVDQRNAFFDSLPKGDPNKPKLDLQYPEATQQTSALMSQYSDLTDPAQKGAFLDAHPDVIKQWNAQADYTNKLRDALGYTPLKNYPEATPQLQQFIDQYSSSDKGTKKGIRSANPGQYQNMIAYFDSLDLYNIGKQASVSQLQGEPNYTSKEAKAIQGLAKDVYQNPDGTYSIVPAGWMQGLSNGSSGGYGGGGYTKTPLPYGKALSLNAGGKIAKPKVSVKLASKYKSSRGKVSKPKVTLKASKV